jgi:nitrite reductase/ring-hydroxylating ferredoxin subunit
MAQQQHKLKIPSEDLKNGEKREVEVEGFDETKVLLVKVAHKYHALSPRCTHYGAPLVKGILTGDGRLTCPWHGGVLSLTNHVFPVELARLRNSGSLF